MLNPIGWTATEMDSALGLGGVSGYSGTVDGFDWISLCTDYGYADGFAAACRGVIARIAPQARVLDVTHAIPPGDVRHGSWPAVMARPRTAPVCDPAPWSS